MECGAIEALCVGWECDSDSHDNHDNRWLGLLRSGREEMGGRGKKM